MHIAPGYDTYFDKEEPEDTSPLPTHIQRISNPTHDLQSKLIALLRLYPNASNEEIVLTVKDLLKRANSKEYMNELQVLQKLAQQGMVSDNPSRMTKDISIPQEYFLYGGDFSSYR